MRVLKVNKGSSEQGIYARGCLLGNVMIKEQDVSNFVNNTIDSRYLDLAYLE